MWFAKRRDESACHATRGAHVPSYLRAGYSFSRVVGRNVQIFKWLGISHACCQIVHLANQWEGPVPVSHRICVRVTGVVRSLSLSLRKLFDNFIARPSSTSSSKHSAPSDLWERRERPRETLARFAQFLQGDEIVT